MRNRHKSRTICSVQGCNDRVEHTRLCAWHLNDPVLRADRQKAIDSDYARARAAYRAQTAQQNAERAEQRRLQEEANEAELLSHPSVIRLGELLSLPRYQYDASEDTQRIIVDCIESIPVELRRIAFNAHYTRDPFWPIVETINIEKGRPRNLLGPGGGRCDGATTAISWIYGISRQWIEQVERRAYAKVTSDPVLRGMARELDEPAYRFTRGVSGRSDSV